MSLDQKQAYRARTCAISLLSIMVFLVMTASVRGETLNIAGDVFEELDVVSATPRIIEYEFPAGVVAVHSMTAWVTGKQILGTFVQVDGDQRSELSGGVGLALDLAGPCGGAWEHRSSILPQGTWDYDVAFEWNDAGSGCAPDLESLLGGKFSAEVVAFPQYQPTDSSWWEPEPKLFLVAVVLEFDVEYAVPASETSWGRVKALYD